MINLLPQLAKKKLLTEYRFRLGIIALWAIFVLELLAFALYTPSFYILNSSTKTLELELAQKKLLAPPANEEIPAQLAAIKKEVTLLKPSDSTREVPPSLLLGELLKEKPRGIELSAFAYAETNGVVAIQLSGTADTREELLAFQRALKTSRVDKVKFGSSFITKKSSIDFNVTITFK